METVQIYKGQPVGAQIVKSVTIEIATEIPVATSDELLDGERLMYQQQAELLCNALLGSLPQGTTDRLLAELLRRKASLFVFPQEG